MAIVKHIISQYKMASCKTQCVFYMDGVPVSDPDNYDTCITITWSLDKLTGILRYGAVNRIVGKAEDTESHKLERIGFAIHNYTNAPIFVRVADSRDDGGLEGLQDQHSRICSEAVFDFIADTCISKYGTNSWTTIHTHIPTRPMYHAPKTSDDDSSDDDPYSNFEPPGAYYATIYAAIAAAIMYMTC